MFSFTCIIRGVKGETIYHDLVDCTSKAHALWRFEKLQFRYMCRKEGGQGQHKTPAKEAAQLRKVCTPSDGIQRDDRHLGACSRVAWTPSGRRRPRKARRPPPAGSAASSASIGRSAGVGSSGRCRLSGETKGGSVTPCARASVLLTCLL